MPRLFDSYIMVDWSAASSPKTGKDSIWIADLDAETNRIRYTNPPTRAEASQVLKRRLSALTEIGSKVLLGFDFSLGYPLGTAKALGLNAPSWEATHSWLAEKIKDDDHNRNNRFEVASQINKALSETAFPFWGVTSTKHANRYLDATKPDFSKNGLPEYRLAEAFARGHNLGTPKSVWQLAYIGSVGSQSLMGIPYVEEIRRNFSTSKIWPFETGFQTLTNQALRETDIVIAEIYPSLLKVTPKTSEPLDKAQVRTIARHYGELDKSGDLGAAFAPPKQLNAENLSVINNEEGWILGITPINIGHLAS